MDSNVIRLLVQPAAKGDVLLGPGFASSIVFEGPDGIPYPWPVVDEGDGDYRVDIRYKAENPRFDNKKNALIADKLTVLHPHLGDIEPIENELPLRGFTANVLGVQMPITIWALVANKRSKETHLITCHHAQKISKKNKVWLHDLNQVKELGYDTCEHCLPLICNTSPSKMEAHKMFCSHARRIKTGNRIEVHNWKQAEDLGFDGCAFCLPDKHTR